MRPQKDYFKMLRELCGYVENGSETVVKIYQDDATKTFTVLVGKQRFWGYGLEEAVQKAYEATVEESTINVIGDYYDY